MKKTIIALLALAGMASAATTITSEWITAPSTAANFYSGNYSFQFTLDDTFTLADSGSVLAAYWGTDSSDAYGSNAIVLGGTDGALTLTVGRGALSSTTLNATTTMTFKDKVTFTTAIETGVTYTVSVTGGNQAMTPTLTWDGGTETLNSYAGNMNGHSATMNYAKNDGIAVVVPEPATATLSLLALAGLAARRRR